MNKLTTIIANYNYAHFLKEAVLSIVKQKTASNILIIDDASTDNSQNLIKELAKSFPQVEYFFKEKNQGVEEVFNTGLKLVKSQYVHFFASDDLYLPNSLEKIVEFIHDYPEVNLICSDFAYFNNPSEIFTKKKLNISKGTVFSKQQVLKLFKRTNFWIPGHTVIVKKEAYLKYAPQEKQLGSLADWVINHTMALQEGIGYIPQSLIAMRCHENNYSTSMPLQRKKAQWLYLLSCFEKEPHKYKRLWRSGILRMLGLRPIYKDLLFNPTHWKYLFPMMKREIVTRNFFNIFSQRS